MNCKNLAADSVKIFSKNHGPVRISAIKPNGLVEIRLERDSISKLIPFAQIGRFLEVGTVFVPTDKSSIDRLAYRPDLLPNIYRNFLRENQRFRNYVIRSRETPSSTPAAEIEFLQHVSLKNPRLATTLRWGVTDAVFDQTLLRNRVTRRILLEQISFELSTEFKPILTIHNHPGEKIPVASSADVELVSPDGYDVILPGLEPCHGSAGNSQLPASSKSFCILTNTYPLGSAAREKIKRFYEKLIHKKSLSYKDWNTWLRRASDDRVTLTYYPLDLLLL